MKPQRPLFWHQGLFLQPQHFQQFDIFTSVANGAALHHGNPWFWGVNKVIIDEHALQNRTITLTEGEFVFPDTSFVSIPENGIALSRQIDSSRTEPHKPFMVYAGIRKMNLSGTNVCHEQAPELLYQSGSRYCLDESDSECADLHDNGAPGQVLRMKYVVRIFFDFEREAIGDYSLLPLGYLEFDGEHFVKYNEYSPPVFNIAASPLLMRITRGIADQMLSVCRQLEQYKVPRENLRQLNDQSYFVYMLGLMVLNRYVPLLYHHLSSPSCHPFQIYGILRQIIGELSSFTDRFGCLADLPDGTRQISEYDHIDAARCFERVSEVIVSLIRLLITGPENSISLQKDKDGAFSATIPLSAFENVAHYYLIIRTSEKLDRIIASLHDIIKISSREAIAALISRSLPGLPVSYTDVPPPGIPRRADTFCFSINVNHQQWMEIQKSHSICIYWDSAPQDISFELVIMRS